VSLFHRHQWQEVARRFVPATGGEISGWGIEPGMVYDMMNGYTGKVSSEHIQGDAT
jgi:hypothetical protein